MELIIKPSSATWNLVLGIVALVLLVLLIVLNIVLLGTTPRGGVLIGICVGGAFGIVIGAMRLRWGGKSVAAIGERGITVIPEDVGLIPWNEIRHAEVKRLFLVRQLVIETDRKLQRMPFRVAVGLGLAAVKRKDHYRLSLGLGPIDKSAEEVQSALEQYQRA